MIDWKDHLMALGRLFLIALMCAGILYGLAIVFSACGGKAAAESGLRGVVVPAPYSGVRCFAILRGDGTAVGGNCI